MAATTPKRSELRRYDAVAQPYRELHARIFANSTQAGSIRSVLFTASRPGEGCSTVANNMALYLSQIQPDRVLLVEVNIGRPPRKPILTVDRSRGLLQVARGVCELNDVAQRCEKNLYVLPSGRGRKEPVGNFSEERLCATLSEVRKEFAYVVIDGPTVSGIPQAASLVPASDGVVLVARANSTRRQVAERSVQRLKQADANLLGVVLSHRRHFIPGWLYRIL